MVRIMAELFVKLPKLRLLLNQCRPLFLQPIAVSRRGRGGNIPLQLAYTRSHHALQRDHIFGTHPGQCAFVVAVQIDEALEGFVPTAAEQPVDGALLVGLQMVLEEAVAQVAAQRLTAGLVLPTLQVIGQEGEVVFEVALVPSRRDELDESVGGIVVEPFAISEWDDAVWVGREPGVAAGVEVCVPLWA